MDTFLTFSFSAPSSQWEKVDGDERVYAFDMLRCPVADSFCSQGLEDLRVKTRCNLDFPLARPWRDAKLLHRASSAPDLASLNDESLVSVIGSSSLHSQQ